MSEHNERGRRWPSVMLTFDFDAFSLWISRSMTSPGPLSRGEFGRVGVERLLPLLNRLEIKSTWFIPGHTAVSYPSLCRDIAAAGHEVAMHGWNHEAAASMTGEQEYAVMARAIETLESVTGQRPTGNRSIPWDHGPHTVENLERVGMCYDSSLLGTDYTPYLLRTGDRCEPDKPYVRGKTSSIVELPVSWTLDDYPIIEYFRTPNYVMPGARSPREMFRNFVDDVEYMVRDEVDGACVITFHPQVIGRGHRMLALEEFLERLKAMPVALERCDEVALRGAAQPRA